MDAFIVSLFAHRAGFHIGPEGWARFRRGQLVDASPAVWSAFQLRAAHFNQIGF